MSNRSDQAGDTADRVVEAKVVAAHGRQLRVLLAGGAQQLVHAPGRRQTLVCGDRVLLRFDARHGEWRVQELLARTGCLYRSNQRGQPELLAAHLHLLLIVVAPVPEPDSFIVDRYLAAAESAGLSALILLNKCELPGAAETRAALAHLAAAGYELVDCSAVRGQVPERLRERLAGRTAILVGQSGVGKSSLLQVLVPDSGAAVGALDREDEGRHTTTATRWHVLPGGGALLDSPGVRDFAPAVQELRSGDLGFVDIGRLAGGCRFADCRHWREPDCAVRAAVDAAQLDARRLESFRRLWRLRETLLGRTRDR